MLKKELKTLSRHGATYGLAQVLGQLAGFLLIPLYTHHLEPKDYGILQLVNISLEVVGIVISMGVADTIYRFYYDTKVQEEKILVISTAFVGTITVSIVILVGLAPFSRFFANLILNSSALYLYFLFPLVTLWFNNAIEVVYTYLRLKERSRAYLILSVIRTVLSLGLIIYLIVVQELGVMGVILGNLTVSILLGTFGLIYLIREVGIDVSFPIGMQMLRYALPIIPANIASLLVNASDRYFVKYYVSISDVGLYTLGYKLGNVIHYFIRVPFMQIWAPRRFKLHQQGHPEEFFAKITTYYFGLMTWGALAVSLFVFDVIKIISPPSYWQAANYTPFIALAYVIYGLDQHVGFGIAIAKKTMAWTYVNFSMAIINLIANFILISNFGIWGAVSATMLAIVYKVAALYFTGKRYYSIPFEWWKMVHMLIIAAIIVALRKFYLISPNMIGSLSLDAVLTLGYIPTLWLLGIINKKEKTALVQLFSQIYKRLKN